MRYTLALVIALAACDVPTEVAVCAQVPALDTVRMFQDWRIEDARPCQVPAPTNTSRRGVGTSGATCRAWVHLTDGSVIGYVLLISDAATWLYYNDGPRPYDRWKRRMAYVVWNCTEEASDE